MINNKILYQIEVSFIYFLFFVSPSVVFGSEDTSINNLTTYPSTWISGNVGVSNAKDNELQYDVSPTIKLMAGYDFNNYLGVYGGYDYIKSKGYSNNILSFGLKGNIPIFDMWSFFGKMGISYLNVNTDHYNISGSLGLGLEYKITNAISTQIGFDYFQNIDTLESKVGISQMYWGMTYRFGQALLPVIKSRQVDIVDTITTDISVLMRKNYLISFPTGQSVLDNEDKYVLAELLDMMHEFPEVNAKITGRADATGNASINDKISKARSLSAYRYLISHGISSDRLTREGLSNSSPISSNSPKNSELERSVQIILY